MWCQDGVKPQRGSHASRPVVLVSAQARRTPTKSAPSVDAWRLRRLRRVFLILENLCFVNAPATERVLNEASCGGGTGLFATLVKLLAALHNVSGAMRRGRRRPALPC